ncbi:hypothetical protein OAN307_c10130 [Octadecabacter antarcticus 307]|uniref:Hemolysin III n=2 Tax=Octadecabacter TaxID=53945 RepID=M9R4N0_9RHOB|nr:hypothetical protein OAN307_c10130 [Octadecabacter antarcticus 307]
MYTAKPARDDDNLTNTRLAFQHADDHKTRARLAVIGFDRRAVRQDQTPCVVGGFGKFLAPTQRLDERLGRNPRRARATGHRVFRPTVSEDILKHAHLLHRPTLPEVALGYNWPDPGFRARTTRWPMAPNQCGAGPRVRCIGYFVTQRHNVQTLFSNYLGRMNVSDPYPDFTRSERIADGAVHIAGIVFAIVATTLLIIAASGDTTVGTVVALSIYGAALIGSFVASACYHFTPWEGPRAVLRRIDHAAIYLKIAGTYTPLVVLIGSAFAHGILGLVWALAAVGAIAKLFFWSRPNRWGVGLYLGLGWLSVALVSSLIPLVSGVTLGLIVAGGLVYSLGAVVFSINGLRYQNAIWHTLVLAASVCFCVAIALGVLPAA